MTKKQQPDFEPISPLFTANGIEFTTVGIAGVEQLKLPRLDWQQAGEELRRRHAQIELAYVWCWADWIIYGKRYGETYTSAIRQTGLGYSTLANYVWVGSATPHWMRGLPGVSFRHYLETVAMEEQARFQLLKIVSNRGWTVATMLESGMVVKINKMADDLQAAFRDIQGIRAVPGEGTEADQVFELAQLAYGAEREIAAKSGIISALSKKVQQARAILASVLDDLTEPYRTKVKEAMELLTADEVEDREGQIAEDLMLAVQLYRAGNYPDMVEVMGRIERLGQQIAK